MTALSKILKSFNKTLTALDNLVAQNRAAAKVLEERAADMVLQADNLMDEAQEALAVADRIRELVGSQQRPE
jgi:hypothetical protein